MSGQRGPDRADTSLLARWRAARAWTYRALWEIDEKRLAPWVRRLLWLSRLIFVTVDGFFRERLQTRAGALAYSTVLAIVPFAALSFSIAKWVGAYDSLVDNTVRPILAETFRTPDGGAVPEGVRVLHSNAEEVLDLVSQSDVVGLGLSGLAVLLLAISRVLIMVERAFDSIWGFPSRRRIFRRLPGWLSASVVTPASLVIAVTLTAARQGQPIMAWVREAIPLVGAVEAIAFLAPPLIVVLGLLPLYLLMPNARVRFGSAAIGALIGGIAWYLLLVVHIKFQLGVARNNALYSGFGALPIFLLWLHLSWVMILLGAQAAAAHQNAPTLRQIVRGVIRDHASRQLVAVRAMIELAHAQEGISLRRLARDIGVRVESLRSLMDSLVEHGLLDRRGRSYDPVYFSTSDPDALRVAAVLEAIERPRQSGPPLRTLDEPVAAILDGIQSAVESSDHNRTIGELRRAARRRSRDETE